MRAKITTALLCVMTIFFTSCLPPTNSSSTNTSEKPEDGTKKILSQVRTVYSSADEFEQMTFAHYEDTPDILLIDMATACDFVFDSLLSDYAKFEIEETDTTLTITRDNGAYCLFDFTEDSIFFNNFDLFRVRYSNTMSDILMSRYVDSQGKEIYFKREDSTEISGHPVRIDLAERDIPLDVYEGKKYIPFQTLNDLFISPYEINYLFNSQDVFKLPSDGVLDPALEERYYSIQPAQRSEALASYTVNELCLVLDLYYGLQDEHGLGGGFKLYLERVGLLDELLSTDPTTANTALASLMVGYIADKHSGLIMASPYTGAPYIDYNNVKYDSSIMHYWECYDALYAARETAMPDGVPGYQEIYNTAYVTFDSFTLSPDRFSDYNENSATIDDTLGLIIYAHSMINRENSPIENVVLDLSCNSGGYIDSGVYVVAWMLGYCDLHLTNPISNCFSTTNYTVDVNLDGVFDENDSIADKNLYCIISSASFSCANSVAASLKESGMVTLMGNTSGGGACAVQLMSAADGSLFCFSTSYRESTVNNGTYYNVDQGVQPHVYFSKFESYFNRTSLTAYINNLK